jgi:ubiquinone/menaquinone biosynthesis C-methylase UbiE
MFDRLAPDYDAIGQASFAYFGRRLVEEVGVEADDRVLDIACGRGAVLFAAAERVTAAGHVVPPAPGTRSSSRATARLRAASCSPGPRR